MVPNNYRRMKCQARQGTLKARGSPLGWERRIELNGSEWRWTPEMESIMIFIF